MHSVIGNILVQVYDRRQKSVNKKSKQIKMWDDVTAEMMTEEEMGSDNNYIRRRQSWRSAFNELKDKLDEDRNSGRLSLARPRDLGDSILRSPPPSAKSWMITLPTTSQAAEE